MGRARQEVKVQAVVLHVRLYDSELEQIKDAARLADLSVSAWVRCHLIASDEGLAKKYMDDEKPGQAIVEPTGGLAHAVPLAEHHSRCSCALCAAKQKK